MAEELNLSYQTLRAITYDAGDPILAINRGKWAEAYHDLEGAVEDYTNAISYNPDILEAYFLRGVALYNLKKYDEAIANYRALINLKNSKLVDPYRHQILFCEGNVYGAKGDLKKAICFMEAAKSTNRFEWNYHYHCACYKLEDKQYEGAIKDFTSCLELNPNHRFSYFKRGETYLNHTIHNDKGKSDIKKAAELGMIEAQAMLKKF
jgi:tetratricopeptide (TPR) repeat protein